MSINMSTLDRSFRLVVAAAAVGVAFVVGAGSAAGIVLFIVAGVLAATSAAGFCPLYALVHFDTRGRTPVVR